jgi:hypothetical protein
MEKYFTQESIDSLKKVYESINKETTRIEIDLSNTKQGSGYSNAILKDLTENNFMKSFFAMFVGQTIEQYIKSDTFYFLIYEYKDQVIAPLKFHDVKITLKKYIKDLSDQTIKKINDIHELIKKEKKVQEIQVSVLGNTKIQNKDYSGNCGKLFKRVNTLTFIDGIKTLTKDLQNSIFLDRSFTNTCPQKDGYNFVIKVRSTDKSKTDVVHIVKIDLNWGNPPKVSFGKSSQSVHSDILYLMKL